MRYVGCYTVLGASGLGGLGSASFGCLSFGRVSGQGPGDLEFRVIGRRTSNNPHEQRMQVMLRL